MMQDMIASRPPSPRYTTVGSKLSSNATRKTIARPTRRRFSKIPDQYASADMLGQLLLTTTAKASAEFEQQYKYSPLQQNEDRAVGPTSTTEETFESKCGAQAPSNPTSVVIPYQSCIPRPCSMRLQPRSDGVEGVYHPQAGLCALCSSSNHFATDSQSVFPSIADCLAWHPNGPEIRQNYFNVSFKPNQCPYGAIGDGRPSKKNIQLRDAANGFK